MFLDSGELGHSFDDALIPRLWYKLAICQVFDFSRKIITTEGHQPDGVPLGPLRGDIVDSDGAQRPVQLSCLVVHGLGRSLF